MMTLGTRMSSDGRPNGTDPHRSASFHPPQPFGQRSMLFRTALSTSKLCITLPVYRRLYPVSISHSAFPRLLAIRTMATNIPKADVTDPTKVPNPLGEGKYIQ